MNITVVGTGYVGLVTGVALAEIGHDVLCVEVDEQKALMLKQGLSPIYEPDLQDMMNRNMRQGKLSFTATHRHAYQGTDVVIIAVGTPQKEDGSANLDYLEKACQDVALSLENNVIVVIKSTVPVGTNDRIEEKMKAWTDYHVELVSNPEFLREGSAVYDTFHNDRIVIGAKTKEAGDVVKEMYSTLKLPVFRTDRRSAELIKYASNAFLATKISFINEIANLCEKLDADVEDVAKGMGLDRRIGYNFLRAGLGYGGSCFPKDTEALVQIAGNVTHDFLLLKSVIEVNNKQRHLLVKKAQQRFGSLAGKKIALLGLAFKPDTDDMREAASIMIAKALLAAGATVHAYDPVATESARAVLPPEVSICANIEEALVNADAAMIATEWDEIKGLPLALYSEWMKEAIVFDGRNCYSLEAAAEAEIEYYSVGRPAIIQKNRLTAR